VKAGLNVNGFLKNNQEEEKKIAPCQNKPLLQIKELEL